jgi:Asp-tRNA(Asn)/Glu-tRNA(Gln) amidotransferase A subunit family amidase
LKEIRVGVFDATPAAELDVLKSLGVQTVPVKLPTTVPVQALGMILSVEAAAAFDELVVKDVKGDDYSNEWANTFRSHEFVSAVHYVQANRARTLLMREMEKMFESIDCYIGGGFQELGLTNLTGHPTVVCPNGFRKQKARDGSREIDAPQSVKFTGRLYGETELLAVGHAWQQATGHHLKRPTL